ncbi:MAG: Methytransferase [Frankiales bacterium]|nr:Methytransferase [Frankiales bacterium]
MESADIVGRLRSAGCVYAEDEARLLQDAARDATELHTLLQRRIAGAPLEYILGWAEFCGLRIEVEDGVFVPRRRTEYLVAQAACDARAGAVVVDLCCGSGAVGAALLSMLDRAEVHAVDIEAVSVRCAVRNLVPRGGRVYQGDLFEPLPAALRSRVDILVANVPYVPSDEIAMMPSEAREYEPRVALDGGADGLDIQRRVAVGASRWLAPGGRLLIETSERQAPQTVAAFERGGLVAHIAHSQELDATVVIGAAAGPIE